MGVTGHYTCPAVTDSVTFKGPTMHTLYPLACFGFSLLALLVLYSAARVAFALAILCNRLGDALDGSSVPPVFASSCSGHGRPLPSTGQGGAAFPGVRS